jgi:MFS family permease
VKLWRNPAFVVFWLSRTISFAGTGITTVVLPVLVFRLTGAPVAVAALNVLEAGPYIAFGLLAGALADRLSRKAMMVTGDAAAASLLAAVPAATCGTSRTGPPGTARTSPRASGTCGTSRLSRR